jgi:hypothetical protein
VPFRVYTLCSAPLPLLEASLVLPSQDNVQHQLWFSLHHHPFKWIFIFVKRKTLGSFCPLWSDPAGPWTLEVTFFLGKWPTWCTVLYHVFIFIFNSLHVPSTSCLSSGETNCVNTTSGNCHSVLVTVSCAGQKFTSDLHTTRPPIQSDSYQKLYWHNLSLLMMSTVCS